ncbi:MAG: hypothetical protein MZV65_42105 [Chromatiales bacterium]|nr:hypothetical protein [Chromatiales bacterium]
MGGNNWQCETVPGLTGVTWSNPSIAVWNNLPRIAFQDSSKGLNFAYKDGTGWHYSLPRGGADILGENPSLILDDFGIPHISYKSGTESVAHSYGSTTTGGTWINESIPGTANPLLTSIAYNVSPSAYPCILYYEATIGHMKYTCKPTTWTTPRSWSRAGDVGKYTSLALDDNGVPHIAYQDKIFNFGYPKIATWSDTPGGCSGSDGTDQWKCEIMNSLGTSEAEHTTPSPLTR